MRRIFQIAAVAIAVLNLTFGQVKVSASPKGDDAVAREPFTLKLRDKDHDYEKHFDERVPFVANNSVNLFAGEKFGINLKVSADASEVTYQPDAKKADVWFVFTQEKKLAGGVGMMLVVQNKLKSEIRMEGLMTVPRRDGVFKTGILPIGAGLSNFESWPHPIVELTLKNFRLSETAAGKSGK